MLEDLFQSSTSASLLGAVVCLLVIHFLYSSFSSEEKGKEPPGPRPLPLVGNLLQVDPKMLDRSLFDVRNVVVVSIRRLLVLISIVTLLAYANMFTVTYVIVFSYPKSMDQCSQSTWPLRRWWSWQDIRQSDRL